MRHGPARKLTSTERAERYGVQPRRLNEADARAARVQRMLAVLDRAWWANNPGQSIHLAGDDQLKLVCSFSSKDWHDLARQADPDKEDVKAPSPDTCQALIRRIGQRVSDALASQRTQHRGEVPVCFVCGAVNCHSVNCAEECGLRNAPREVLPAEREIVRDRDAALGEAAR